MIFDDTLEESLRKIAKECSEKNNFTQEQFDAVLGAVSYAALITSVKVKQNSSEFKREKLVAKFIYLLLSHDKFSIVDLQRILYKVKLDQKTLKGDKAAQSLRVVSNAAVSELFGENDDEYKNEDHDLRNAIITSSF